MMRSMTQSFPFVALERKRLFSVQWVKQRVRGVGRVVVFSYESTFKAYMAELSVAGVRCRGVDAYTVEVSK